MHGGAVGALRDLPGSAEAERHCLAPSGARPLLMKLRSGSGMGHDRGPVVLAGDDERAAGADVALDHAASVEEAGRDRRAVVSHVAGGCGPGDAAIEGHQGFAFRRQLAKNIT